MDKKEFIKKYADDKNYINYELCSTCTDVCCKKGGCDALPLDINPFTPEHIIEMIDKGFYSIVDAHPCKGMVYPVLRSKEEGSGVFNINKKQRPCSLLRKNGCTLDEAQRPTTALLFIPKRHPLFKNMRSCQLAISTSVYLKLWEEKLDIMEEVVKHYSGGKNFKTVYTESFEDVSKDFYKKILNKGIFNNADIAFLEFAKEFKVDIYDSIMDIAKQKNTVELIINNIAEICVNKENINYGTGGLIIYDLLFNIIYKAIKGKEFWKSENISENVTDIFNICMEYNQKYLN